MPVKLGVVVKPRCIFMSHKQYRNTILCSHPYSNQTLILFFLCYKTAPKLTIGVAAKIGLHSNK